MQPVRRLGRIHFDPVKIRRSCSLELALLSDNLPANPPSTNWRLKLSGPLGFMLNDSCGDCTCATQGHLLQSVTANASTEYTASDPTVLGLYQAVTLKENGVAFDQNAPLNAAGDNPTDTGCQMSDVIDQMITTGIDGHKYLAKLSLSPKNFTSWEYALQLFGNLQIGVSLTPESLQNQNGLWDIPNHPGPFHRREYIPNPALGHAVAVIDYNADGSVDLVSWGQFFKATPAWLAMCVDEAWCVLTPDWQTASNLAPNMISWPTLQKYYPSIAAAA